MSRLSYSHTPILAFLIFFTAGCNRSPDPFEGWKVVNGNPTGNKYSSLAQIDTSNVKLLKTAWIYHTGDDDTAAHSQIQCNPIIVNGTLYGTSPQLKLFALDAATGYEKWVFRPFDTVAVSISKLFAQKQFDLMADGGNFVRGRLAVAGMRYF